MIAWRPATADDRTLVALVAGTVLAAAALAVALAPIAPALARVLPDCAFHALSGLPCPACGSTRAVLALLAGEPRAALGFNPLVTFGATAAFAFALAAPLWLAARGSVPRFVGAPAGGMPRAARVAIAGTIAAQWAWLVVRG